MEILALPSLHENSEPEYKASWSGWTPTVAACDDAGGAYIVASSTTSKAKTMPIFREMSDSPHKIIVQMNS